jgi:polygalacturonase
MKKIICVLVSLMSFGPFFCLAQEFVNPLEIQNFVYSEKKVQEYMQKAADTKPMRVQQAFDKEFEQGGPNGKRSHNSYFAALWLSKDLDQVNNALFDIFTSDDPKVNGLNDYWSLSDNQWLYRLYYSFSSKGTVYPGRLYPKTEKALLELLWQRMKYKDDILMTRWSTWWMTGSENHDIVAKVSSLISSQIFMNEPDFKDRIYPDLGNGGGYEYWFHSMYGTESEHGPKPRGNYKDGKAYMAADHYNEWLNFFHEYFTERAKKGFFLEVASPGYMAISVPYLTDLFDLCKDRSLTQKAEKFLDAVWADWAVDQINGVRGGAKTRVKNGNIWEDAMYIQSRYYFGGEGSAKSTSFIQLLTNYKLKPIIWSIALDRKGLGEFAYVARKPGEEENIWPRPLGTERTMLCDTEARFVRYSWITPDYILGCQMDHPAAVHSHLSVQARWLGITFKGENGPRIYPTDAVVNTKGWTNEHALCRAVQSENVMLAQQARRFFQVNPDWYPSKLMIGNDYGIFIGDTHDQVLEKEGWIFVEHGDAFAAVRVVNGNDKVPGMQSELVKDNYTWSPDKKMIYLNDKYAGMIFETSRRVHHKTLEAFMDDILDNPLVLDKTVVAGFNILRYRGCGENAGEMYFNLTNEEISMLDGERIDYSPDMLFESPYIKSKYKSGIIKISKDDQELVLDFNSFRNTKLEGSAAQNVYNVLDFGAVGDGKILDSPSIQKAIDAAAEEGSGARVLIPGGYRYLVGTLTLMSDIDFHLERGAELYASTNPEDYINQALIRAQGAKNLTISGEGNINGRAHEFMTHFDEKDEWWIPKEWRPRIFVLESCKNLTVKNISFSEAPSWGLHMLGCEDVLVDNIKIRNHLDVPNCDGIDPDHCRNVEIKNCHIICGDDAIVIKATRQEKDYGPSAHITVKDCILETQDSGVKIGTETTQDIHDIIFERCEIITSCRGLTIQLRDEGDVYNVVFRDINFVSRYHSDPWWGRGEAISITAIPRTPETNIGTIHDVEFQNISGKSENSVRISGTPESRIRNVRMENVNVRLDRWTRYEGGLFDNRPTTKYPDIEIHGNPGFSIRYADNVVLDKCTVSWGENLPDYFTHALEAHNISKLDYSGFKGKAAHPERDKAILIK